MDVIAHGLWGGSLFCSRGRKKFIASVLLGMAPDLLSFGAFHLTRPGWVVSRLAGETSGPPPLALLPAYVFHAYNITHSLITWSLAFLVLWRVFKRPQWLLAAWLLHILCDIPTHATSYFPTPFLWPLATPFVDGIAWSTPWFMAANYLCLATVYTGIFLYARGINVSAGLKN